MTLAVAIAAMIFAGSANGSTGVPAPVLNKIHHHLKVTHHYQDLAHVKRTPYGYAAERTHSLPYRLWLLTKWRNRAFSAVQYYRAHRLPATPWTSSWYLSILCVHTKEGPWRNPNYGGLGLMTGTQSQFGSDMLVKYGTNASAWSPIDQIRVAWRVYSAYGWYPWPWTGGSTPVC